MKSFVQFMSKLEPRLRRTFIMMMDVLMVLVAIPLSLALSQSRLSFDATSALGFGIWIALGLFGHVLFRASGLYNTVWRFASTPDFFNIIKNCGILAVTLYAVAMSVRFFTPVTGINERQFIALFLVAFTLISAPRLMYRYLREGAGWAMTTRGRGRRSEARALFVGSLGEADIIIRFARAGGPEETSIVGIMAIDVGVSVGTQLQGVPVVATQPRLAHVLEEYAKGTKNIDLLIFGHGAEKELEEFSELVRVARQNGIAVSQFSGLSQLKPGGKLVLEAVEMETILRRSTVPTDVERIGAYLKGKRVLVTGGAGSIGRTLVKRSLQLGAKAVLVADLSEFSIFRLSNQLNEKDRCRLSCRILDVGDKKQFGRVVSEFNPDIIFHAAALKHVPLLEENWVSAVKTNVFGTLTCAEVAAECSVPQFVLVSSDKAADPTSILGLTKRVAEQIVNSLHFERRTPSRAGAKSTIYSGVRFGNVFGSDGSVATVFQQQIKAGGPITITDRAMTRYLMTMSEAVDLVIMSAADSAEKRDQNGYGIYMLDMGDPVSILTVAETMIRLAGLQPHTDIPIQITGIRPGEKLHESLSANGEQIVPIDVPSIFGLQTGVFAWQEVKWMLKGLRAAVAQDDKSKAVALMSNLYRAASEDEPEKPLPVAV
jgi:O-antigen biosynthesis protein WbqV